LQVESEPVQTPDGKMPETQELVQVSCFVSKCLPK